MDGRHKTIDPIKKRRLETSKAERFLFVSTFTFFQLGNHHILRQQEEAGRGSVI